jgi:hypothetical protein
MPILREDGYRCVVTIGDHAEPARLPRQRHTQRGREDGACVGAAVEEAHACRLVDLPRRFDQLGPDVPLLVLEAQQGPAADCRGARRGLDRPFERRRAIRDSSGRRTGRSRSPGPEREARR